MPDKRRLKPIMIYAIVADHEAGVLGAATQLPGGGVTVERSGAAVSFHGCFDDASSALGALGLRLLLVKKVVLVEDRRQIA